MRFISVSAALIYLLISVALRRTLGTPIFSSVGRPGVANKLANELLRRFPGVRVAGICSPPFRKLTHLEDEEMTEQINRAAPDVLWVRLGCPKQERWMREHQDNLRIPVV